MAGSAWGWIRCVRWIQVLVMSQRLGRVACMPDKPKLVTAEELDAMSPNERATAFDERVVRDVDELPTGFRERVMKVGQELSDELRAAPTE